MAQQTSPEILGVGDHVRLKSRAANQHESFRVLDTEAVTVLEPVEGLIFSIRNIKTGHLVAKAEGSLDNYVIELVFDHTFNARYASLRNAPRGSESPMSTASWKRLHAGLRSAAERGEFYSTTTPELWANSPLVALLDGWKVIKVNSQKIESLEKPEPVPEAPVE